MEISVARHLLIRVRETLNENIDEIDQHKSALRSLKTAQRNLVNAEQELETIIEELEATEEKHF